MVQNKESRADSQGELEDQQAKRLPPDALRLPSRTPSPRRHRGSESPPPIAPARFHDIPHCYAVVVENGVIPELPIEAPLVPYGHDGNFYVVFVGIRVGVFHSWFVLSFPEIYRWLKDGLGLPHHALWLESRITYTTNTCRGKKPELLLSQLGRVELYEKATIPKLWWVEVHRLQVRNVMHTNAKCS